MTQTLDDAPDNLIESARHTLRSQQKAEQHDEQGRRLARRLLVAFVLSLSLAAVFFVFLPQIGIDLPPLIPIGCFGVILAAAVLNHASEAPDEPPGTSRVAADDDGRPVGCCSGPGHMRCFRKDT